MKKISIVSMHRVYNQGSFLQAYALKMLVNKYGNNDVRFCDIEKGMIDTNPTRFNNEFITLKKYGFKNIKIKFLKEIQKKIQRNYQNKYLDLSKMFEYDDKVDLTIIGSDEVFNCKAPSSWGISKQLFGDVPNSSYVISYAASAGHTKFEDLSEIQISYIKDAMKKFDIISVRDNNTKVFVEEIIGIKPEVYLDPVLIYDFENEIKPIVKKFDYLLVYAYTNRIHLKKDVEIIKNIAKKEKLKIICVGEFQYWADLNIPANPFLMMSYFKGAKYIITDTFHGAICSIKYCSQFVCLLRNSNSNKLKDLLFRLECQDRIIEDLCYCEEILFKEKDYTKTNEIIENNKKQTDKFFAKIFKLL